MTYRAFPPYDRLSTFLLLTLSLGSAILPSPATRSRACIHRLCVFRSDAKFEIQMSRTGRRRARSRIHAYVYIQCTYIGIRCNVRTHARGGYLMRARSFDFMRSGSNYTRKRCRNGPRRWNARSIAYAQSATFYFYPKDPRPFR